MFNATIVFRWIALVHVFILFALKVSVFVPLERSFGMLAVVVFYTLSITLLRKKLLLNLVRNHIFIYMFIGFDLLIDFALMTFGGGFRNAWYLYTFNTALTAAAFGRIYGALLTSALLGFLYLMALNLNGMPFKMMFGQASPTFMADQIISNIISYILGGAFFAYPAMLIQKLNNAHKELEEKNKELNQAEEIMKNMRNKSQYMKNLINSVLEPEAMLKMIVDNQNELSFSNTEDEIEPYQEITNRELEILKLLSRGMSNKEISDMLGISTRTVETHKKNIYRKLNVSTASQAIALSLKQNIID